MTKKYGVVSTGILSAGKAARDFRAGAIVEFGPEEHRLFVDQAPQNFVELVEGFEWNAEVAATFMPGDKHFKLTFDVEAQKQFQRDELAKIAAAAADRAKASLAKEKGRK